MHQGISLLVNIAAALVAALVGGLLAKRLKLPTMVGYLAAGVAIGPFTPGFVGDTATIHQLAEIGVVFLMFGVGLHFSLRDLWNVRDTAIPGAIGQMLLATLAGFGLTQLWGWSVSSGLLLGVAISTASTVVLLRGLMDHGTLNTPHGQVAVGWLVLEDLATVVILVLLPLLFGANGEHSWMSVGSALLRAAAFIGLVLLVGARFAPWLLKRIVLARSRELFILAVVTIALGTAVGSAELFGVSLALGAFLAGVVLGETSLSHQIGADVLPLRDTFTVLFFVSVGMLVNVDYLLHHAGQVFALVALIIGGKSLITIILGIFFPRPARTVLVVAAGLSQIGEFSFLVGQAGLSLRLLNQDQYSLILAGALVSIMLNPLMFQTIPHVEAFLRRWKWFWRLLDRGRKSTLPATEGLRDHVVVVGYGRVGRHAVTVLGHLGIPHLVVELDGERILELQQAGVAALYGDAANSEVLSHTGLKHARALVVTVAEDAVAEIIVATAREAAPQLPIVVRSATHAGMRRLSELGAQEVIYPEMEGGIEVLRHLLLMLGYPVLEAQQYADAVRRTQYKPAFATDEERRVLDQLLRSVRGMEIAWTVLAAGSPAAAKTLGDARIREETGATVIAILQNQQVIANPDPATVLNVGDVIGLLGEPAHVAQACQLLGCERRLDLEAQIEATLAPSPVAAS
ncbi:MAG: sodium:proton exchanger [Armatimonadetes bacterium]|nr:sodium:proton exchanger [Armatimonadota bacterium]